MTIYKFKETMECIDWDLGQLVPTDIIEVTDVTTEKWLIAPLYWQTSILYRWLKSVTLYANKLTTFEEFTLED